MRVAIALAAAITMEKRRSLHLLHPLSLFQFLCSVFSSNREKKVPFYTNKIVCIATWQ